MLDGWRSFLPWRLALLAGAAALFVLQWREGANARWRSRISGFTFVSAGHRGDGVWMVQPRIDVAFPGKHTASIYGPSRRWSAPFAWASRKVAADSLNIRGQTQQQVPLDAEPVTVVVVMGESINAARLSVFGFKADTTPGIAKWRAAPPEGFTFIPQIGFSGGLDTYASVPGFLRAAYWPVQAQKFGVNLFELAHQQGFKSWYPVGADFELPRSRGRRAARRAHRHGRERRRSRHLGERVPAASGNSFIFVHQRVNHTPYMNNCASGPDGLHIFDTKRARPTTDGARLTTTACAAGITT